MTPIARAAINQAADTGNPVEVAGRCQVYGQHAETCPGTYKVTVDPEGARKYRRGGHVQDAFPNLSAADRELLLTGITDECFNHLFGGCDADEEG